MGRTTPLPRQEEPWSQNGRTVSQRWYEFLASLQRSSAGTVESGELATVATSGNASDLTGLAEVALTGSASDLSGTLPSSALPASGVSAGTYTVATVTVDAAGRVTDVEDGSDAFGTIASQDADDVAITGGAISGLTSLGVGGASGGDPAEVFADADAVAIGVRGRASDNVGVIRFLDNARTVTYGSIESGATYIEINLSGTGHVWIDATALSPSTNNGHALGSSSRAWSDLFLATGGVVNWGNGDVTITQSTGSLTYAIGGVTYKTEDFDSDNRYADALIQAQYLRTDAHGANVDIGSYRFFGKDSAGNQQEYARFTARCLDDTSGSESGQFVWFTAVAGTVAERMRLHNGNLGVGTNAPVNKLQVSGSFGRGAPVTKTADFTLGDAENWVICNKASSTTATLPAASSWTGREFTIKTIQAQTVVSASSNVVPIDSATAGTAILPATDGAWATLVSNGTNWVIMQRG